MSIRLHWFCFTPIVPVNPCVLITYSLYFHNEMRRHQLEIIWTPHILILKWKSNELRQQSVFFHGEESVFRSSECQAVRNAHEKRPYLRTYEKETNLPNRRSALYLVDFFVGTLRQRLHETLATKYLSILLLISFTKLNLGQICFCVK